jgi:hypothetical protein
MADTVTSQTLVDGVKTSIIKFTNVSDGTGESTVKKVDVSALSPAATTAKIMRAWFTTDGMSVDILFDATANVLAFTCPSTELGYLDFRSFGGIQNNAGAGVTGDILFTTRDHTAADTYSIILEVGKT